MISSAAATRRSSIFLRIWWYLNAGAALSARHAGRMFDLQVGDGMHGATLRIVAGPASECPYSGHHRFGDGSDGVLDRHVRIGPRNRRIGDIF